MNYEEIGYNGKNYVIPIFSQENPIIIEPTFIGGFDYDKNSLVIGDLNQVWDLENFKTPRTPISFGLLERENRPDFVTPNAIRTLDMPIKFPGTEYRLPKELKQFEKVIEWIANVEQTINPLEHDKYFAYLTVDQRLVKANTLHREAPCHVDGFQGARWNPKVAVNHTYTLSDALPTAYYPQPFNLEGLDESKHDFFWEFNRQVAETKSRYAIQFSPWELVLMNAYSVHRGVDATVDTFRTWLRLSYEVREFDRLGNAHNPLFDYNWKMVERDIEQLGLTAFDPNSDPSLRVFPWQDIGGNVNPNGVKTKPNLRPI